MGRRDNLKILTTAILVVLLLSSFIFAFIYRNEIYQKLQTIGKNKEVEMMDREIAKSPETIPPPKLPKNDSDSNDSYEDRSKLPDLPSLDDMEPEPGRQRSVSVASSTKGKEPKDSATRLKEKLDQVEEEISPKEIDKPSKKITSKEKTTKPIEEEAVSNRTEDSSVKTKKVDSKFKQTKSETISSAKTAKSKQKVSVTKSTKPRTTKYKETSVSQKTNTKQSGKHSSLEVRMRDVEQKLSSQNDRNEKRFLEIERRIDSLEKALAK